ASVRLDANGAGAYAVPPASGDDPMRLTALFFAPALCAAASALHAAESAYTERNLDRCETISQTDEGPSVTMKCGGYRDLAVYFKESDLRQSQAYGPIGKAWLDE